MGIECRVLMTKMSAPIGNCVGNSLEILESVNCLKGQGPSDLQTLVEVIGSVVVYFDPIDRLNILITRTHTVIIIIQTYRRTFTRHDAQGELRGRGS